ncbi:family 16 glycosylhydrolase [Nocardioides jiangxiensis]|uniref:Family 16 glycosylhydrolase n=1 Tax=Nocardioides jiangxiensis TaxID=3064524 RepID=A0ABT9B5J5_9ACTN|nr:family 16 glycosylhydrolase [Nocardioides sp. WY-20]MDO7869518.1 family 16 glycosylhydrolase [Nocardioides sp. WY-20]
MSRRVRAAVATAVATLAATALAPLLSPLGGASAATSAGAAFGWGGASEVWDWERGESTTGWRDVADGTGRVGIYYGQLGLDSGPASYSSTASGDVLAWLDGNAHSRGRWEFRMKSKQWATATPYQVRLELVPAGTPASSCGTTAVTLASWNGYTSSTPTRLGVRNGTSRWTLAPFTLNQANVFHTYAVEIKDTAITWFVDAKAVGRLTSTQAPGAFSTTALVPRLVLDGPAGTAMTHTRATTDWDRYFTLARAGATIPTTTPSLTATTTAVSGMC